MTYQKKQSGMTILELMIAITIFAIITGAVFSLYINSNRSYNEDEIFARMQENGRFALNRMSQDIQMVDFWGEMINPPTMGLTGWGEDCDMGLDTPSTTASPALQYYNYASPGAFVPTSGGCAGVIGTLKANTNAVAIKRVANGPSLNASDYSGSKVYLETNGSDGNFVQTSTPSATAGYSNWLYQPNLYYIKETGVTPYLCRAGTNGLKLLANVGNAEDECIAEGVEQLHIEFGIDTDGDGVANRYRSDTTTDAVTARIFLLLSSDREVPGYVNNKTYKLGNLGTLGPYGDGRYRRVFSTTVVLRNPRAYILLE